MSNRDGFGSGFWLGTLVGGVVGGIVGVSIATQRANRMDDETESGRLSGDGVERRPFKSSRRRTIDRMEIARQSLDDKISDLNNTIDAVRSSIGSVAGDAIDPLTKQMDKEVNNQ
jgi:gas vesicle protein